MNINVVNDEIRVSSNIFCRFNQVHRRIFLSKSLNIIKFADTRDYARFGKHEDSRTIILVPCLRVFEQPPRVSFQILSDKYFPSKRSNACTIHHRSIIVQYIDQTMPIFCAVVISNDAAAGKHKRRCPCSNVWIHFGRFVKCVFSTIFYF